MKLSRPDVTPLLAIILGGAVGALASISLVSSPPASERPPVEPIVTAEADILVSTNASYDGLGLTPPEALERTDGLLRQQREVLSAVEQLPAGRGAERTALIQQLRDRKAQMRETVLELERDLDDAAGMLTDEPHLARTFRDAASLIRGSRLREALRYSRGTIEQWDIESAVAFERSIEGYLQDLRRQVAKAEPTFTPFTVAPSILNQDEIDRATASEYPRLLREAGVEGRARVYFLIEEDGRILDTRIDQSSGHPALDNAALAVANAYEFSAALNRDKRVPVWVSFTITFRVP